MGFTNPRGEYSVHLIQKWSNKTTDYLIEKLNHPSVTYSGVAAKILAKRKDDSSNHKLISIINDPGNYRRRYLALSVLFSADEKSAIPLSMNILEEGRQNPLFNNALLHLAKRQHEAAYPYAVQLAMAPDRYNNGSAAYLADFGKKDSLAILNNMLQETTDGLYRAMITRAIQSIREQHEIKS